MIMIKKSVELLKYQREIQKPSFKYQFLNSYFTLCLSIF
jgi:hypothetical protein